MNSKQRETIRGIITAMPQSQYASTIGEIISDLKSWQNPNEMALMMGPIPITIGMLKTIPNWETNACVIYNLCATYSGRLLRGAMESVGAMPDFNNVQDEKLVLQMCEYTDKLEMATASQICGDEAVRVYKADQEGATERLLLGLIAQGQTKH